MVLRLLLSPILGITWIAEQIKERVDTELDSQENLQKRLLALQLAFDMGDVEEEEFMAQEEELLGQLQELAEEAKLARDQEESG